MAKKKEKLTDEYLAQHAQAQFNASSLWRSEQIQERWKKDNDLYNSKFATDEKSKSNVLSGKGRLFIPKTYSQLQRILVDILDTVLFDPEEIVDISSWKNIPDETKQIVKSLLNYRLNGHPICFYEEAYEMALDALKNKAGVLKVWPDIRQDKYGDIESYKPVIECVPYEDVFFSTQATWKDYYKFPIIHRMKRSKDHLKRKGYKNLDRVTESFEFSEDIDEIKSQRSETNGSPFSTHVDVDAMKQVYLYEIWTFLDVNGDGLLESCSYLMVGDAGQPKIIVRGVEENTLPYKQLDEDYNRPPFILSNALPEPHQLYGKSYPEITEGLQRETNAIRNQRREAVALALRKPVLVSKGAGVDVASIVNRRIGGVVMGDDISEQAVREMNISDPTHSSLQEHQITEKDYYEASSIPPDLMGMPSSGDQTATGVTAHVTNANKKIAQIIRNLVQTGFIPAFRLLLRLEQEYCSDEFVMMVTNRQLGWGFASDGAPATEYIQGEFDLTVNMGMNKQTQVNKFMMLMERGNIVNQTMMQMVQAGVIPMESAHYVDTMKLFHQVLPLVGAKNIEEYMIPAQPPPPPPLEGGQGAEGSPGVASQPALTQDIPAGFSNMNPEMMEDFGGIQ